MEAYMRHEKILGEHVWLGQHGGEYRRAPVEGALLTFYIKPADGIELPDIMQWMMNGVHDERNSLSRRSRRGST
jgi:hypothetical protein